MNATDKSLSLYLMDWHGNLLSHDPFRDDFTVSPFTPGILPDLTLQVPSPFSLPSTINFVKHTSMPKAFPPCILEDAEQGYVSLFSTQTKQYLTCLPAPEQNKQAVIRANSVQNWERLIPLSQAAFRGLSLLMLPNVCAITSQDGTPIPALTIQPRSNIALMNGNEFSIIDNINSLSEIGLMNKGQTKNISLINTIINNINVSLV
ncbi:hypothetical protein AA106555_1445 [Neokomagataea thailandica NBRC 106555]|uniref:Uncharacterized protein n=2 Tax=Neokomagataea TaxID=1223423 RepID=A0A4Y6V765_9PROT|nr:MULTISPECIES: hypothetical protein [Neokomagataea]QDH24698.1 hypothetical protein D5366_05030 [Neokomagataea tanensis]GBR53805.1 hypothetical protein AA106555_1445 [Neokomagataea thailandica NBRC 106555]